MVEGWGLEVGDFSKVNTILLCWLFNHSDYFMLGLGEPPKLFLGKNTLKSVRFFSEILLALDCNS